MKQENRYDKEEISENRLAGKGDVPLANRGT